MLIVGLRPSYRRIPTCIRSTKRYPQWTKRESHSTTSRYRGPRRNYTILLTLPLVAALYGFYSRRSYFSENGARTDEETGLSVSSDDGGGREGEEEEEEEVKKVEVKVEEEVKTEDQDVDIQDEDEVKDEDEPLEDFTTYPPPVYDRQFWVTPTTTEEELNLRCHVFQVDIPCGITRFDVCNVSSAMQPNCISSSQYSILPSHYWYIFGIYDGHNGNIISSYLAQKLPDAIADSLIGLYSKHATLHDAHVDLGNSPENQDYWSGRGFGRPYPPPDDFDASVKQAFCNLDKSIVDCAPEVLEAAVRYQKGIPTQELQFPYEEAATLISGAHSGSSAMVAIYESDTRQLRLANLGNSGAVLGRRVVDDQGVETYEVHVLAHELDIPAGFVDDPPRRKQVPGSSRLHSFGDGPWKWSKDIRQRINDVFPFIIDHEYPHAEVTPKPEIITFEAQPGDFLVMGNRGLWSSLTYEEAVGLVGLWLKRYRKVVYGDRVMEERDVATVYDPETSTMIPSFSRPYIPSTRTPTPNVYLDAFEPKDLPVQHVGKNDDTFMYQMWGIPKKFVVSDRNAAQHLVRNALGGANVDMMQALLMMRPPRSRKFRDDVCVEVIFFD